MRTLPWRKKDEDFDWVKHEKTQLRIRREARDEHLTAMGYLLRVFTSLLGLKIIGFIELILLKTSRLKTSLFGWLTRRLPFYVSALTKGLRSMFSKLMAAITAMINAVVSSVKWTAIKIYNGFKIVGNLIFRGAKGSGHALGSSFAWGGPKVNVLMHGAARGTGAIWDGAKSALAGFGRSSRNVTKVITQKVVEQRRVVAYTGLTLAVFGGVIGAVSMGVFSQLPKNDTFTGVARIIDADLIKVGETDIRLFGIDAPEPTQRCKQRSRGRAKWQCGRKAVTQLSKLVNKNQVTCARKGTDNLGRVIAKCSVDQWDIAAYMVREGLAWVTPGDPANYAEFQAKAKKSSVGIWRAKTDEPWNYRETRWSEAKARAPEGCPVKGNISGAGRVYYLPWSNQYERVHIQPKKGERWFCNEREAIQAGWRMTRYP